MCALGADKAGSFCIHKIARKKNDRVLHKKLIVAALVANKVFAVDDVWFGGILILALYHSSRLYLKLRQVLYKTAIPTRGRDGLRWE
jgi:hypothetical protein